MRKKLLLGNWKMNKTVTEAKEFALEAKVLGKLARSNHIDMGICVPSIDLEPVKKIIKNSLIVGAQNCHYENKGAFTGEVAPEMLKSINVKYVIIGHSERRQYFNETDESVNKKIKASFNHDLIPIVCVGETLEERENGKTIEKITKQTEFALEGLSDEQVEKTIIAYEPIWAIGTGKTATKEDANNSIKEIRNKIGEMYGQNVASRVIILYGGSVKSTNAKELFEMSDIDGGLVGGASLNAEEFSKIVNYEK